MGGHEVQAGYRGKLDILLEELLIVIPFGDTQFPACTQVLHARVATTSFHGHYARLPADRNPHGAAPSMGHMGRVNPSSVTK